MIPITGNTYRHRAALKAMGGRWSQSAKAWMVPADKADDARRLVGNQSSQRRSPRVCESCRERINFGRFCGKCEWTR
jgi:hypothetical protein